MNKQEQVTQQCKAVAHMATAIAQVHSDYEHILSGRSHDDSFLEIVGRRTASFMEQLGNMLNAMDACEAEDRWMAPIFKEAQRRWPVSYSSGTLEQPQSPRPDSL